MRLDLKRLVPHDGNYAISSWVGCEACERGWTDHPRKGEQGWFAIPRGMAHEYDPLANIHLHSECANELRDRDRWANHQEAQTLAAKGSAA